VQIAITSLADTAEPFLAPTRVLLGHENLLIEGLRLQLYPQAGYADAAAGERDLEDGIARGDEELRRVLLAVPAILSLLISIETTPLFCLASLARELPKQFRG
jgi:hypothetical protein